MPALSSHRASPGAMLDSKEVLEAMLKAEALDVQTTLALRSTCKAARKLITGNFPDLKYDLKYDLKTRASRPLVSTDTDWQADHV